MSKFYLSLSRYLTVLLMLVTSLAWSQSRTVTGKVTSADDGAGLPGVNVIEKGTNNGTATDADGNYSLNVGSNATLVFSFVGYQSQETVVGNQSVINSSLTSDVTSLSEVVVVGYGTQEKKEITSAVASVKAAEFNKGNVNDPSQLLAGKVAGLQVVREGSNPNQGFNIRLRGLSTIGANSSPLIVIDGVIGASLNSVDPNDIESMDVLKDGSAAAIYGTRGSAGVILITTKKGTAGKTTVDYNAYVSSESIAKSVPVLTADEFRSFSAQQGVTGGDRGASTDWLDEITENAVSHVHTLSLGGGTASGTTFRASINFRDIDGILRGTGFNNLNGRLNLNQKALNDKLTLNAQFVATQRKSNFGFNDAFRYATIYNPTAPIKAPNDDPSTPNNESLPEYGGYYQETRFDFLNPVSIIEQNKNEGQFSRLNTSVGATYDFTSSFRGSINYSMQTEDELFGRYFSRNSLFVGYGRKGLAERNQNKYRFDLLEATLNYDKSFGDLNLAVLGGYSYQEFFNEGFGVSAGNFISDAFTYNDMGSSLDIPNGLANAYSYKNNNRLIAFFGRVNLNFKETYFLSASARQEGSSRFGANNKWKLFPAVSGGVTISNLVDLPSFNNLKLRAGYGVTGQQPNDSYLSLLTFGRSGNFIVNGQYVPGYAPTFNANPDLAWEQKAEYNIGLDFILLNSRLSGSIDYYNRTTTDFLQFQSVPVPPNLAPNTWLNGGDLRNSGLEVALNYALINKADFILNTGINLATFSTEIKDLNLGTTGERFQAGVGSPGQNSSFMIRVKEGQPVGQIFGPKYVGIDEQGKWIFEDTDGNGSIDEKDFQVLGKGLPDFTLNWNTNGSYKNFDFSFMIRSAFGHSIVNQYRVFYEAPGAITSYNVVESARDISNLTDAPRYSSLHVEKGDYVNLDNLTLGYTFPLGTSSALSKVRLYVTGQNLFMITGYKGADPEVRYVDTEDNNNPLSAGIDRRNTWVRTRTLTLGLNLGF
jgi:TonB-dependent starch-binding outer membrane protein SusC